MLLFGSDPELFASINKNNQDFVVPPVFFRKELGEPILQFDFKHPVFTEIKVNGNEVIKVIEDGAAFELTVPPRTNILELIDLINIGYEKVNEIVSKHNYEVKVVPTINYDTEQYMSMGDDFLMCLLFGCDPDKDAFNTKQIQHEESALEHPYRYGGGHLHISGSKFIKQYPIPTVRLLALTVGNFVTSKSPVPHLEKLRTYRYGMPGKYRIQPYGKLYNNMDNTDFGIEYRTPSNTWTKFKEIAEGIQYWAEIAIEKILPNRMLGNEILHEFTDKAVNAILDVDQELANNNLSMIKTMVGE